jgi:hypothetical protein
MDKDYLLLKRAALSRPSGQWNEDDFDVLADGTVVGRIFKARASPVGASMLRRARRRWRGSRKAGGGGEAFLTLRVKQAKIDGL